VHNVTHNLFILNLLISKHLQILPIPIAFEKPLMQSQKVR